MLLSKSFTTQTFIQVYPIGLKIKKCQARPSYQNSFPTQELHL